jgi:hypothetical protein
VVDLKKAAGERCKHARYAKGCAIYAKRPLECRTWSCAWLAMADETPGVPRPDRAHIVIDIIRDEVMHKYGDGTVQAVPVVQMWCDPAFPEAHKAPALRAYMLNMATRHGAATIIRYDSERAFVIYPPPLMSDRQWHEKTGVVTARNAFEAEVLELAR